jgi:hypothetical protein
MAASRSECYQAHAGPATRRNAAGRAGQGTAARAARLKLARAVIQRRVARCQVAPSGARVGLGRRQRGRAALQLCALLGGGRLGSFRSLHSPGPALR